MVGNSQNMALLEANVSPVPIIKEKKAKVTKNSKEKEKAEAEEIKEEAEVLLFQNALVPTTGPQAVSKVPDNIGDGALPLDEMSVYVVRSGDTIGQIAEMFDVSVNTILWANDLKKGQKLTIGDTLLILPVSGVKHMVVKGQSLKTVAKLYKVEVEDIVNFNGIDLDESLAVGDELIIPDGVLAEEAPNKPSPNNNKNNNKVSKYYASGTVKNILGYFINPVPDLSRKSQGLHNNNRAVDLAAPTGTNIYSSATGEVLIARNGYNGGYGNMVIVQHPNGTKTLYAHMSKIAARTGTSVSQGELIGYVGNTGRSTGPHLHFEVHGAKNPGGDWSWKY